MRLPLTPCGEREARGLALVQAVRVHPVVMRVVHEGNVPREARRKDLLWRECAIVVLEGNQSPHVCRESGQRLLPAPECEIGVRRPTADVTAQDVHTQGDS